MRKRNVCIAVLFLGIFLRIDLAYGQCGSSHIDDGPGSYASSTSSDHCGFAPLQPATISFADQNISTVEYSASGPVLYSTVIFIKDTDVVLNTYGRAPAEDGAARSIKYPDEGKRS